MFSISNLTISDGFLFVRTDVVVKHGFKISSSISSFAADLAGL